jgi:hypothetical protein
VQETCWTGQAIWNTISHTILSSGKENGPREAGTAFTVWKSMKSNIIYSEPISERMCLLRLRTKFFDVSIVNVYAPTEDKEDSVKDDFYGTLGREYDSILCNDIKMIVGNLNAKVWQEEIYKGTTGLNSLHTSCNDNGRRLIILHRLEI